MPDSAQFAQSAEPWHPARLHASCTRGDLSDLRVVAAREKMTISNLVMSAIHRHLFMLKSYREKTSTASHLKLAADLGLQRNMTRERFMELAAAAYDGRSRRKKRAGHK